ncbi:hypothetical protein O6H91_01G047300 [Diphasiastrum complanatum]|uniref:Uncharacterized protein n=1 Tax=Diphasiastrum complanatum TaxID=34168 RepID=A0ACC2EQE1_DIPCM|nr:hypothetical protein O6H91_01G047300 [Diphasiastrum complanatum]
MMNNKSNGGGSDLDLPQELLGMLPSDPYEQLDVARRITAMAISGRVARLEAEAAKLRQKLGEKEHVVYGLQERLVQVEHTLQETTARLSHALDEQAKLANEKNVLLATVKRLNRDVAKLETFKRTLMQSLQEDEEISPQLESAEKLAAYRASSLDTPFKSLHVSGDRSLHRAYVVEDDGNSALSLRSSHVGRSASMPVDTIVSASARDDDGHAASDAPKHNTQSQRSLSLTPHLTPQLTPTGSPKRRSTAGSPRQQSGSGSPKHHSSNEFKVSLPSSQATSQATTAPNSPPPGNSLPTRTPKVDGKEFFRKARNRLSYEQFSAFLTNIKELNAHRQTREETLKKADEIFGPENKDLYASFDGLLSRHLPS